MDGLLLDLTGRTPDKADTGIALATELEQSGASGWAMYDARPGAQSAGTGAATAPDGPPLGWVKTWKRRNLHRRPGVVPYTDPINEAHVSWPGLVVVDVAAADDDTALAFQQLLAERWATATEEHTTRDAGEPGVRLRCYLDLRQPLDS
ncbi:DUF6207 family protein [Streptomyces sp. NPDC020489]|uniref:DUF6207 family protein n=1 Tax=Streptomyces sp. NPDC020489 TaxID=3365077 RepID=UPI00378D219E